MLGSPETQLLSPSTQEPVLHNKEKHTATKSNSCATAREKPWSNEDQARPKLIFLSKQGEYPVKYTVSIRYKIILNSGNLGVEKYNDQEEKIHPRDSTVNII